MGKKKVLVVDDNPDIRLTVKEGLEAIDENIEVIGVESGEDCINLLNKEEFKPDVILLDIMLPEMSGWEIYNRLKENAKWRDIPIIFLTARTDDKARKIGSFLAEDFIEKPFDIMDLKERIEKVLERKKSEGFVSF